MEYDPEIVEAQLEEFVLADQVLEEVWQQKTLRRVWLNYRRGCRSDAIKLIFYQPQLSNKPGSIL